MAKSTGSAAKKDNCPVLDLQTLMKGKGLPALTVLAGGQLAESATVALHQHSHPNPVPFEMVGFAETRFKLKRLKCSEQMLATYGDMERAREDGAYGIAILLICKLTPYTVVERSYKTTGIDYWLGPDSRGKKFFEKKARLEVSGMGRGSDGQIDTRVRQKIAQTWRSDLCKLPAYVVVFEYRTPVAKTHLKMVE